tara:strand:- start:14 stop:427 length:414 start_codon:yes stop_codon:yes gene_type:complete
MKLLMENWKKYTAEALEVRPALPGEMEATEAGADPGETTAPEEEENERYHDTFRVLEAYWDDEEEEIKAYYDKVKEEFEKPGGILDQIERMSGDERRAALDDIQQRQEPEDPAAAPVDPDVDVVRDYPEYYGAKSKR